MPDSPLRVLDKQIENRVSQIVEAHPDWPCRRGCDHCCRSLARPPLVTEAEWVRVEAALRTLPPDVRSNVLARITDSGRDGRVCPLLDEEKGECLVYLARPIACRTYGFYADREGGLYCDAIASRVQSGEYSEVTWGNYEAVEARVGDSVRKLTLEAWVTGTVCYL